MNHKAVITAFYPSQGTWAWWAHISLLERRGGKGWRQAHTQYHQSDWFHYSPVGEPTFQVTDLSLMISSSTASSNCKFKRLSCFPACKYFYMNVVLDLVCIFINHLLVAFDLHINSPWYGKWLSVRKECTVLPGYKDVMSRSVFIITAPSSRKPGDPLVISDIKKGSVAHR